MLACIGQFLLCVAGGFWAGNAAEPGSGATSWTGAVGMAIGLFVAYATARTVGMALGALLFGKQVLRWLRSRSRTAPRPAVDAQTAREERGLHWVMTAVAVAVLLLCSVIVAILVFVLSQDGSLAGALSRFLLVAGAAALLTLPALHAVNEVHWGAPPPA